MNKDNINEYLKLASLITRTNSGVAPACNLYKAIINVGVSKSNKIPS